MTADSEDGGRHRHADVPAEPDLWGGPEGEAIPPVVDPLDTGATQALPVFRPEVTGESPRVPAVASLEPAPVRADPPLGVELVPLSGRARRTAPNDAAGEEPERAPADVVDAEIIDDPTGEHRAVDATAAAMLSAMTQVAFRDAQTDEWDQVEPRAALRFDPGEPAGRAGTRSAVELAPRPGPGMLESDSWDTALHTLPGASYQGRRRRTPAGSLARWLVVIGVVVALSAAVAVPFLVTKGGPAKHTAEDDQSSAQAVPNVPATSAGPGPTDDPDMPIKSAPSATPSLTPTLSPSASPSPKDKQASTPFTPGTRVSLQATTSGSYITHSGTTVSIAAVSPSSTTAVKTASTWIVRAGLANSSCISFESADTSGSYLRHSSWRLYLNANDNSSLFQQDATFCPVIGNSGSNWSFASVNYPTKYIRCYNGSVYIASNGGFNTWDTTNVWSADSTWVKASPWTP